VEPPRAGGRFSLWLQRSVPRSWENDSPSPSDAGATTVAADPDSPQARTRIMNQLQAVALNEGLRCKKKLWREKGRQQLEAFRLAPSASRRREDLGQLANT
jgi:hypothetical protein